MGRRADNSRVTSLTRPLPATGLPGRHARLVRVVVVTAEQRKIPDRNRGARGARAAVE